MNKVISALLLISLAFASFGASASELESLNANFSISPILNNYATNEMTVNISLPSTVNGGTLLMAFYTDSATTKIIKYDTTDTNTFSSTVEFKKTPDEIKLFLWEAGRILPLRLSQNALDKSVITEANKDVVSLLSGVDDTANHIREYFLDTVNSDIDKEVDDILSALEVCASTALKDEYSKTHLLTSEYAKREFGKEAEKIYSEMSNGALDRLWGIFMSPQLREPYATIISDFIGFFDFKLK